MKFDHDVKEISDLKIPVSDVLRLLMSYLVLHTHI